jgi:hypothetical protein
MATVPFLWSCRTPIYQVRCIVPKAHIISLFDNPKIGKKQTPKSTRYKIHVENTHNNDRTHNLIAQHQIHLMQFKH